MRYRYLEFDPSLLSSDQRERLIKLFLQLLMRTGGNVEEALEWLDQLAQRYGLWNEEMNLEELIEQLLEQGYISADVVTGKGDKKVPNFKPKFKPTRKAERSIRLDCFDELFSNLRADSLMGNHVTPYAGEGGDRLPETRPYEFGDRVNDIDFNNSIANALRRSGLSSFNVVQDDLEVFEVEHATSCATVLALDISHSMILYGEDRITPAKKVALAMTEMIQTQFPKDSLDVIVFGDEAMRIDPSQLSFVQVGPFHTNTKAAFRLAQRILERKHQVNKQIVMITDGKPSAIDDEGRLYINSFGLDARIVNETVEEAQLCRRKGILITTFMITTDPYLKQFVDRLSKACKGRAYYAELKSLGKFVLMDYCKNRRKLV